MARYTVNLSRARSFSRRRRAQKAMTILREKLEEKENEKVSIAPEINSRIWENGVERPPAKLEVEVVETPDGPRAVLPGTKVEEPEPEPEPEEEEETVEEEPGEETEEETEAEEDGSEEVEADYDEIVSGTVSEAKEDLQELDDPDWEAALEAEKENKDRKTLKEWLESRT